MDNIGEHTSFKMYGKMLSKMEALILASSWSGGN